MFYNWKSKKRILISIFAVLITLSIYAEPQKIHVATFDSGFGGFFTAKSIEKVVPELEKKYDVIIYINHYGDTKNAPYGAKTPEQIGSLTTNGVKYALNHNADIVFIACNTASTQYKNVIKNLKQDCPEKSKNIYSIIDPTVEYVKKDLDQQLEKSDTANFCLFATPVTVKSMSYPKKLAELYNSKLLPGDIRTKDVQKWDDLKGKDQNCYNKSIILLHDEKKIYVYQVGPANWVGMIEKGASDTVKKKFVTADVNLMLSLLPKGQRIDVLGFFCTHYPVFKEIISDIVKSNGYAKSTTDFVIQGPLMANLFLKKYEKILANNKRTKPISEDELKRLEKFAEPKITLTGDNVKETKGLTKSLFPNDPMPEIKLDSFTGKEDVKTINPDKLAVSN